MKKKKISRAMKSETEMSGGGRNVSLIKVSVLSSRNLEKAESKV